MPHAASRLEVLALRLHSDPQQQQPYLQGCRVERVSIRMPIPYPQKQESPADAMVTRDSAATYSECVRSSTQISRSRSRSRLFRSEKKVHKIININWQ